MKLKRIFVSLSLAIAGAYSVAGQAPGQLPPQPKNIPAVGEKAPDFTLPDASGREVKLSSLLKDGPKGSWVLLVFYRGYW